MKRTQRRKKKANELAVSSNGYKTVGDMRNTSKSKEQMKKDWGSPRSTMDRKLSQ